MKPFEFCMPVDVVCGENCVTNNVDIFRSLGKRALVITYDLPAPARHYALEDVEQVLKEAEIEYVVNKDAIENPTISSIVKIAKEAMSEGQVDFIIGCGGGSAIDSAKVISLLLKYPDAEPYDLLFTEQKIPGVPLVAIPTTCGTGSECTRWASVTRDDTMNKGSIRIPVFAKYAFVDARYIAELPRSLTCFTALDTLCHCSEVYLTTGASFFSKAYGEMGMKLFSTYKDALLKGEYTKDERENMMLCATLGGVAISQAMSALPHGLSKPVGVTTHMPHGLACASTLVPYLKIFEDKTEVNKVVSWCGFSSLEEMDEYMHAMIDEYVARYSCTDEDIDAWAQEVFDDKKRLSVHPGEVTKEMLVGLLNDAYAKIKK